MTLTTAPLFASSSDPRAPRWGSLIRDIQLHRLTRVVAPAGYNKSAFAAFIYDTVPRAHRITFSHAHTSLHGALTHLSQSLQLDHVQFELPGLLSSRARLSPSQFARVLQQDMAHPSLDGLMLILDDVHLLESNAAAVLVQIATASTRRVNVVACVRHPDEFPADLHYGMPVVDITERELAYTADELRDVADHADPYGYPALAHAVRSGLSARMYMRRLLALIDEDLLLELCRAALIPVWPLSPEQARTLDVRPLLVRDALAADLPIIRTDPTTEQYVPHPELAAALLAILSDNEQQFRDAHARLSRLSAASDPVLAVRHAMLARESDRAAEIAVEWLSRSDDVAGTLNDDLLLTLVPVETLLPPTLRLRLATTLSQHGQHTEALGILSTLRGQRTPDAAPEEVHLGFARVYAATGAYAKAFEEIQQAVVSERPFIRAFAAHLVITMHARSGEEQVARNVGSLDDARRWSESALQQLSRQNTASTDAELMALCVQVYLGHWEERSMLHLRARLELLLLREQFEHPETGHALLLLHRLMTDHGLGTLAVSPLESARRLLALTPDAQAALLCAEAREALRQADPESAAGTLLVARESFQGTDPYLHTEIELLLTCALYTLANTPADVLQQAAQAYAVAAAATPSARHQLSGSSLRALAERRLWEEGRSGSKLDTLNSQLRELLPDLLRLRCETAPVVLMTLLAYDLRTKDLAMERTWQIQEAARTLGRATVSAYRDLLAPTFEFLRSADLTVRVIGTPSVSVDDLELRLTQAMAVFIVYLAVTRGRHTRKQLADALYDGNEATLNVMLNRLYKVLRDQGLSSDLLGKPENVRRGGIHTTDHHRVTLDLDQYSANAAGLRAALGTRGVSHLLANSDHPWVLTMREAWRRQYDL